MKLWLIRKILNFLFGPHVQNASPVPHLGLIVLSSRSSLSQEAYERLRKTFEGMFPGMKVIVLEEDMQIKIL